MVTRIFLTVFACTSLLGVANAYADDEVEDPGFNMLDMRFAMGALPVDGAPTLTVSLGLGVEHPVFKKTRMFGEYEWMWLFDRPTERTYMIAPPPPERHGTGHRAMLGLRRELIGKGRHSFRAFIDGELGGGLAITNDNMHGMQTLPTGFIGLRAGYDVYSRMDDSPSRTFEFELLFRMVAVPDGIGSLFGLGMAWGN
ncbi:MAG TPA: hypothetical protein VMZ53_00720 [Kofleriaceae bacterium]|nr:hypothetical protein [Kofleriaceae bacterium]